MTSKCRQLTYQERTARFPLEFVIHQTLAVAQSHVVGKPDLVVEVPGAWRKKNIVSTPLSTKDDKIHLVHLHRLASPAFAPFLDLIDGLPETYDGSFVPRLKRTAKLPAAGSGNDVYGPLLSNHSRGTAIDLNASILPMGKPPTQAGYDSINAILDHARSIRVPMESHGHLWEAGIVWGGDWVGKSQDAMHWEIGTFEPSRIPT